MHIKAKHREAYKQMESAAKPKGRGKRKRALIYNTPTGQQLMADAINAALRKPVKKTKTLKLVDYSSSESETDEPQPKRKNFTGEWPTKTTR